MPGFDIFNTQLSPTATQSGMFNDALTGPLKRRLLELQLRKQRLAGQISPEEASLHMRIANATAAQEDAIENEKLAQFKRAQDTVAQMKRDAAMVPSLATTSRFGPGIGGGSGSEYIGQVLAHNIALATQNKGGFAKLLAGGTEEVTPGELGYGKANLTEDTGMPQADPSRVNSIDEDRQLQQRQMAWMLAQQKKYGG